MSNPSFSNIDLWLFELNEGNLTPSQIEQLQAFLLQHPELDVDKDVWENARIQPGEQHVYTKKASLIRANPVFKLMDYASVAIVATGIVLISISDSPIAKENGKTQIALNKNTSKDKLTENENSKWMNDVSKSSLHNLKTSPEQVFRLPSNAPQLSTINYSSQSNIIGNSPKQSWNQVGAVTGNLRNATINNATLPINEVSTPPSSEMGILSSNIVSRSSYELGQLQEHDLWAQTGTNFTSNSFYKVNELNVKEKTSDLGQKELALVEMNKDHELNFFQKKKKTLTKYQLMMKTRVGSFGRKVMGMMNNNIALRNYRDPHYSIPGLSVSDINFSSAGSHLATRVQTFSRMQWYGQQNQQLMNQLNVDGYVFAVRGGLALQMNHAMYNNGGINLADVAITYSPKISLANNVSLEPSFRFKMGNKSLNHAKMDGANQLEIDRGVVEEYYADGSAPIGRNLWYKDFGAGVLVNTEWFYASVQIDNVFRHKDNMYSNTVDSPRRSDYNIIGSIGTDWVSRNKKMSLSPYVVYQNQGALSELWVGANARLNWFVLGASYSSTRNPSATIGMKFKHFSMYYNADYSKSLMTGERNLSHQLTLKFVGKQTRFGRGR